MVLIYPYARALIGGSVWGEPDIYNTTTPEGGKVHHRLGCLTPDYYDWEGNAPPLTLLGDTIIYELHVRGYTVHSAVSSGAASC